jgi:hypothetical protein
VQRLDLAHSDVRDEEVELAAGCCPHLHTLSVARTALSDATAAALASCGELEVLDVSGTPLTDSAASVLARLPSLRRIDVRDTAISGNGVEALVASLPSLEIDC